MTSTAMPLVSVFLRELECYQGIMFLTTNRVKQIDDAIASRIHRPLKYELGLAARRGIFLKKAITKKGGACYNRKDLDGRQISIRTGRYRTLNLLCASDQEHCFYSLRSSISKERSGSHVSTSRSLLPPARTSNVTSKGQGQVGNMQSHV